MRRPILDITSEGYLLTHPNRQFVYLIDLIFLYDVNDKLIQLPIYIVVYMAKM